MVIDSGFGLLVIQCWAVAVNTMAMVSKLRSMWFYELARRIKIIIDFYGDR